MQVLLDANLLVLWVVGHASRDYIGRHKRLRAYDLADFDSLTRMLAPPVQIVVTPNVLTEASNLIAQIPGPARTDVRTALRAVIGLVEERHVPSGHAARREVFLTLGLTDAALLTEAEASGARLLTADLDLYLAALRQGRIAENFHHRRAAEGESRPGG